MRSLSQISFDYRDIENVVFIQDFPKLQKPADTLPTFAKDLEDVLDKLRVPASVKQELYNYDYSKAKVKCCISESMIKFVTSVGPIGTNSCLCLWHL